MSKCVFAGSFNPVTIGHMAIINTCLKLFDEVVVALADNPQKDRKGNVENHLTFLKDLFANNERVKVVYWKGAIVDLLKRENTKIYVRGVRNSIDFEYETQNFYANKALDKDIIEIYIPCEQDKLHISSTFVRNLSLLGKPCMQYIPQIKEVKKCTDR